MDKKYLSNILIYLIMAIAAVSVILFVIYHLVFDDSSSYSTVTAVRTEEAVCFEGVGYRFADETALEKQTSGSVYSTLAEGENVKKGGEVCAVYPQNEDTVKELYALSKAIAILEEASVRRDLGTATAKLRALCTQFRSEYLAGNASALSEAPSELLTALLSRMNAAGALPQIKSEIAELKKEESALLSRLGAPLKRIYAPISGNYYTVCDGYEALFSSKGIEELTLSSFEEKILSMSASDTDNLAGKIVYGADWYFAMKADTEKAVSLKQNGKYILNFETAGEIEMTLSYVRTDLSSGSTLLIFSSRNIPPKPLARCEKASVRVSSVKGLIVPTAALRYRTSDDGNGTVGVYTVKGNKITFKPVTVLAEQNGYYIAAEYTDAEHKNYLKLNDVVITSGKGIEEGYSE